ncbi:hypothetical protein PROFUN_10005 [Planoprotostelium fungivorum]|uniref:Uncharacterized protein n=1 Tax=Planoprotostelium fungivorum TaxID=1890364 RepID=A0A2P6NFQ3_9EUKA|nr:hypothetical protein PROFUN_10005 [Planoprotostelium fungivorum]
MLRRCSIRGFINTKRSLEGSPTEWAGKAPKVERPNQRLENEWFSTSVDLSARRQSSDYHIVFLEGPSGSGKGDPKSTSNTNPLITLKWATDMMNSLEDIQKRAQSGELKDKVAFVNRSFLTPYILSTVRDGQNKQYQYFQDVMWETHSCSVVYCKSDPGQVLQRLLGRYELLPDEQKAIRRVLGEYDQDDIQAITSRYALLEDQVSGGQTMMNVKAAMRDSITTTEDIQQVVSEIEPNQNLVDAILHTTSTKQAVAAMLRYYGIGFTFDLSKFKVPPNEEYVGRPGEIPKDQEAEARPKI